MHLMRNIHVVVIPLAGGQILPANPRRRSLLFCSPVTNRYTITTDAVAVLDQGINLYPGNSPFLLPADYFGCAVTEPLFGISAVADQTVGILEIVEGDFYGGR